MPDLPHPRGALSGYVDGRLTPWRRARVTRHLAGCTPCAVLVARTRSVRALLQGCAPPPPPVDLVDRLLAIGPGATDPGATDVEAVPAPPGSRDPHGTGAAGLLVVGGVVLAVVGVWGPGPGALWPVGPRASVGVPVLRPWSGAEQTGGALRVVPVDNDTRP